MTVLGVQPNEWASLLIALAVLVGSVRLLLWRRRAGPTERGSARRFTLLIALQVTAGVLLHLTLNPPSRILPSGSLIVATAGSPKAFSAAPGEILVALPEAGGIAGAARVPDLATALRRHPNVAFVKVIGAGLPDRDLVPLPVPVRFEPPAPPRGLVEIALPQATAAGGAFSVGGRVGALPSGSAELVDPAGAVVDRARVSSGGRFILRGVARATGLALFDLRLRDASGALVERIDAPLVTRAETPPRVVVLAGAPGAEMKFLSRWSQDAGVELTLHSDLGAGVRVGGPAPALTPAALADLDLLVVDDRRWEALVPSTKTAILSAVDGGLGLLLRPGGSTSPGVVREWAALGLALTPGTTLEPIELPGSTGATDTSEPGGQTDADDVPALTRRGAPVLGGAGVALLQDADGEPLAGWRARGRGRLGIWTMTDSYVLRLVGDTARHGALWSDLFSALGRPAAPRPPRALGVPRVARRTAVCGLSGPARVLGPGGSEVALLPDPAAGQELCAAHWPVAAGWHIIREEQGRETPVYVHPSTSAPSLDLAERTAAMAAMSTGGGARTPASDQAPGSPWPWFIGFLAIVAALWILERRRPAAAGEAAPAG